MVTRVADEHSASKVGDISVEIGLLAAVDKDSLLFCFEAITKGTVLEQARLNITEVRPKARCRQCGTEYDVNMDDFGCKACGSYSFEIISGSDISVKEVEVE
jgi:hydrogenase nickel incorporation protein HypA/HybF